MKCRFLIVMITIVMATALLVAACSPVTPHTLKVYSDARTDDSRAPASADNGKKVKIGYCASNLEEEPFARLVKQTVQKIVEEEHPDWEMVFREAKFDISTELEITRSLIEEGCDIIAYHAVDTNGSVSSVEACNDAGVPVVTLVNVVNDGDRIYVGASNYDAGRQMAENIREKIPQDGKIVILMGPPGATNSEDRVAGFKEHLNRDDVEILDEQCGDWMMHKGKSIMETWIEAYDRIDLLFSCSDTMTPGAVEALREAGRLPETMVVSVDGTKEGLFLLKKGDYEFEMFYNATQVAEQSVKVFERILSGETDIEDVYFPMELIYPKDVDNILQWYFVGE